MKPQNVPHTYFDSFCIPKDSPAPSTLVLFQRPYGSLAQDNCNRCGALITGAHQRTSIETNMEMAGTIPAPRIFVARSFSMDFKFPVQCEVQEWIGNCYRFEFVVGLESAFSASAGSLLKGIKADTEIVVQWGQYFAPTLRLSIPEPPLTITLEQNVYGYVRVHGDLFLEVR